MATTLAELTREIDDRFTETWYDIKPDAQDNILESNVVWALLKERGRFVPQTGSDFITETVRYGTQASTPVKKGMLLPSGEPQLETMAMWGWRFVASHVQRNLFDDRANSGKSKIKDYVKKRLDAAREGLVAGFESALLGDTHATESIDDDLEIQNLNDIIPTYDASGTDMRVLANNPTYGKIPRPSAYTTLSNNVMVPDPAGTNSWWGPKYKALTPPLEVNFLSDLNTLFNSIYNNQEPPDLLLTTQSMWELYEEMVVDKSQIVKDATTYLADLGFQVLRYKGQTFTWSPNVETDNVMLFTTSRMKVYYDPTMWFDATEWKSIAREANRIQHILCCLNTTSNELRRFGRLYKAA